MKTFDRIVTNTIYIFSSWLVLTISSFLFWLMPGKFLTQEAYGISLTTVNLIVFISTIITVGFPVALGKLIPEYLKKKQTMRIKRIVSISLLTVMILDFILSIILIINLTGFSNLLKIPNMALKLTIFSFFFLSIANIFSSVLYGLQDMRRRFLSNLGYGLTKLIVASILVVKGYGFIGPVVGVLVGVFVWILIVITPQFITLRLGSLMNKDLYKYSIPGLVNSFAYALLTNSQYIIITLIKSASLTGIFGIAMIISSVILVFPSVLNSAVFPIISELSVDKNSFKKQKRIVDYTVRYSLFFSIPVIFVFSLFSKQLILLYSSPRFLDASKLLPFLSFASLLFGLSTSFNNTIFAMGKPKTYRNILIMISVIFIPLISVSTYLKGDVGATIGYTTTMVVYTLISFFYLRKYLSVKFPGRDLLKILFSCIVSFSGLYFLRSLIHNIFLAGLVAGVAGIVYCLILLKLKFYKYEDIRILKFFSKKFRFLDRFVDHILNLVKEDIT